MSDAEGGPGRDTSAQEAWIDEICDRFENSWQAGRPMSVLDFLQSEGIDPATADPIMVRELGRVEAAYRGVTLSHDETDPVPNARHGDEICERFEGSGGRSRYKLVEFHSQGGMGRVSVYYDRELRRRVALKELHPKYATHPEFLRRFFLEAQITGRLEHPSIVPVYELVKPAPGRSPFYTMRFVNGRTLTVAIRDCHEKRRSGLSVSLDQLTLLNAFVSVCQTVAYAHTQGVVHRDLKGSNVILGNFGEVIVLDWGLAKRIDSGSGAPEFVEELTDSDPQEHTLPGVIKGTPAYLSPEQAAGRTDLIGPRTDVYGLGAILYEILAGQPPFTGSKVKEILEQVERDEPLPPGSLVPDVPASLEAACLRALAKSPADRYASTIDLAAEVQKWLAESADRDRSRQERERFFKLSLDLLCTIEMEQIYFKQVNPAWERTLGWSQDELLAIRVLDLIHPDDHAETVAEARKILLGEGRTDGRLSLENRYRCKDGTYRWFSWTGSLIEAEQLLYAVGRDITERKIAEVALRRSQERFELAVHGSGDGLWDWDRETGESYYSPRWKSMIGYEDHEILHELSEWEIRIHPDDRERVLTVFRTCTEGSETDYEVEYRFRHKDGSYLWILDRGVAVRNATGVSRIAGSHLDITERRRMELELRESEQRHQAAIAELVAELARMRNVSGERGA